MSIDPYFLDMPCGIYDSEIENALDLVIPENCLTFSRNDLFYLYDAIICFTESIYMDEQLRAITSLDIYRIFIALQIILRNYACLFMIARRNLVLSSDTN